MGSFPCFPERWCESKLRVMRFNGGHSISKYACNILEGGSSVEEPHGKRVSIRVRGVWPNGIPVKR